MCAAMQAGGDAAGSGSIANEVLAPLFNEGEHQN
jgi:hypothetical protein